MYVCVLVCVHQLCSHCSTTRIYTHRYPCPSPSISPLSTSIEVLYKRTKVVREHPLLSKRNKLGNLQSAIGEKGKGKDWRKVDGRCFLRSYAAAICSLRASAPLSKPMGRQGRRCNSVSLHLTTHPYPPPNLFPYSSNVKFSLFLRYMPRILKCLNYWMWKMLEMFEKESHVYLV